MTSFVEGENRDDVGIPLAPLKSKLLGAGLMFPPFENREGWGSLARNHCEVLRRKCSCTRKQPARPTGWRHGLSHVLPELGCGEVVALSAALFYWVGSGVG